MSMEIGRAGQVGVQQTGQAEVGRLGGRSLEVGRAAGARAGATGDSGFLSGVKALGSRILDALTPSGVRVGSKAARADMALAKGMDRSLQALARGNGGVEAFRNELLSLRKGERAMGRGGLDFDATMQLGLKNRLSVMPDKELKAIMSAIQSEAMSSFRNQLIDGPSSQEREFIAALNATGFAPEVNADELARPDAVRDLSILEALVLDETVNRASAKGADKIDQALENALQQVGREAEGVRGAVAYVLPTACQAARNAVDELRRDGAFPSEASGQLTNAADSQRAFGLVKTRLEAMGSETRAVLLRYADSDQLQQLQGGKLPPGERSAATDRALEQEISQRTDRLGREFVATVERLQAQTPPTPETAGDFIKTLHDASDTLRGLQQHAKVFDLDIGNVDPAIAQVVGLLDGVNSRMLGLESLENTQIRDLAQSLKALGVGHLDEAISATTAARNEAARERYKDQCDLFMVSVASSDFTTLSDRLEKLQGAAQEVLDIANDLGARIEGADKVSPFRAALLDEALSGYSDDELQAVAQRMRTPDYVSASNTLQDAGVYLTGSSNASRMELGRTTLDLGLTMGMLDEAVAQTLDARGLPAPELLDPPPVPTTAAQAMLRACCGLEARNGGFVLTATTLPASSPTDLGVQPSASRMLDRVADSRLDPGALLESCFTFNQVFATSRSEAQNIDADERQGGMATVLRNLLNSSNDVQLQGLRDNLASPVLRNLVEGVSLMRFGDISNTTPLSDEALYAIGRLGAASESLEVLRILVEEETQTRGFAAPGPQAQIQLQSLDQILPQNRMAIDQALDAIIRLDTVLPANVVAQPVSDGFQNLFSELFLAPPSGSQIDEAVNNDGVGLGVAQTFLVDLGRASLTLDVDGDRQALIERTPGVILPESELQARKQQGIERLQAYCGDDARALALSGYLNQGALAPLAVGLMAPDMLIPGTTTPMASLVRGGSGNEVGFDVSKTDDTHYEVAYTVVWSLVGVDGNEGMVPVNPGASNLTLRLTAQLDLTDPAQPVVQHGPVSYDLAIARGVAFEVR